MTRNDSRASGELLEGARGEITMKVLGITGSRGYRHLGRVGSTLELFPKDIYVVQGGAKGPDRQAHRDAFRRSQFPLAMPLEKEHWTTFGGKSGPLRNEVVVRVSDALVAFWDGKSRGTVDAIKRAVKKGIPVAVVRDRDPVEYLFRNAECWDDLIGVFSPLRSAKPVPYSELEEDLVTALLMGDIGRAAAIASKEEKRRVAMRIEESTQEYVESLRSKDTDGEEVAR